MYTVIVADDEEELRKALIRRVDWESVGFSVVGEAENGAEALELVEKLEPDLLLTDIRMPFVTGIELAKQVQEIRPATQIAFLSGYDDFSYAQQGIQYNIISYLLKPISSAELTEELLKMKKKIDEKYENFASAGRKQEKLETMELVIPLLLDSFQRDTDEMDNKELTQAASSCGLLKEEEENVKYTVIVTSMIDNNEKNRTTQANVHGIDMVIEKYIRHVSFYSGGRVISLLIASDLEMEKYLHIIVEEISQSIRRIMKMSCLIGVSRSVGRLGQVHEAYIEAMNAIRYLRKSNEDVYFISDIERTDDFNLEKMQVYIEEVEQLIRSGSGQELEQYLKQMFDVLEQERISTMEINFLLVRLVSAVFRIVYAVVEEEAAAELQRKSPLQNVESFENHDVVCSKCIFFCMAARELIAEQRKKSSTVLCDKAIGIIENNYMDQELSLVSVSNEISVSPNYLSALIKRSTGRTFIDLLTKKRIETAKELLLCTNMKIKEISEKCGYNDQHYFSYCFKKYVGLSPNACRQKIEEEKRQNLQRL